MSDRLTAVANIYRAAIVHGKPPTVTVAQRLDTSHRNAARLVRAARAAGKLEPTIAGKPSQPTHYPTAATVHRGTPQARQWTVCGSCLVVWPCPDWRQSGTPNRRTA